MNSYYLILNRTVGKEVNGQYYLFKEGKWERDLRCEIFRRLIGFDPSEPDDSPYACGATDILEEIEEISYEKAMKLTGGIE